MINAEEKVASMFTKHSEWIGVAISSGANPSDAEDIVQESYIKLLTWIRENHPEYVDFGMMRTIVSNKAKDHLRGSYSKRTDFICNEWVFDSIFEPDEHDTEKDLIVDLIHEEIESWHLFDRVLMEAYFNLDRNAQYNPEKGEDEALSMRAISKECGISTSTIFTSIKKGKSKIRKRLQDEGII